MTVQAAERISVDGREYLIMEDLPLEPLFRQRPRPDFVWPSTALDRGYLGIWEVRDDRLALLELRHATVGDTGGLACVFPDVAPPIQATWFTGEVTLDIPRPMDPEAAVAAGYAPEVHPILAFRDGRLIARRAVTWLELMRAKDARLRRP